MADNDMGIGPEDVLVDLTRERDQLRVDLKSARALLEECAEWMWSNPPANGWGQLDHGSDAERRALIAKIRGGK